MRNEQSDPGHFFKSAATTKIFLAASPIRRMPGVAPIPGGAMPQHRNIIMTTKLLLPVLIATILAAGASGIAAAAEQPRAFLGKAAPVQASADKVIVITDATRYVNVTGGQTVRFVVGDRSFTWSFQTGSAHVVPFDLQSIAPQGVLTHHVVAYVADNPLYQNA